MNHDIFISYSRSDIKTVNAIVADIEAATKTQCWMDLKGIESGNLKFTKAIIEAINSCPIFLFMLSNASQRSENALKELSFAYKKHREDSKKVVIVYIETCRMTDEFSFEYDKTDIIDWRNKEQRAKLIRDIQQWTNYEERLGFVTLHSDLVAELTRLQARKSELDNSVADYERLLKNTHEELSGIESRIAAIHQQLDEIKGADKHSNKKLSSSDWVTISLCLLTPASYIAIIIAITLCVINWLRQTQRKPLVAKSKLLDYMIIASIIHIVLLFPLIIYLL